MKIGSKEWSELIINGAKSFDLDLDHQQTGLFAAHARELLQWNKKTNLTAITDPFDVAIKHFVDSLAAAELISPRATLLDIGSGGGFPGIPLKVAIPSLSMILIDASHKKINFLKHVIRSLKLEGIEAHHIRAENMADNPTYRNHFDIITSRALTDLNSFIRQARPLLAANGQIIALKGKLDQPEVDTGDSYRPIAKTYLLPFSQSQRSIFIIR